MATAVDCAEAEKETTLRQGKDSPKPKTPKSRRLQEFDENAPTSRSQYKKRKEQAPSQDESIVKCGIMEPVPST